MPRTDNYDNKLCELMPGIVHTWILDDEPDLHMSVTARFLLFTPTTRKEQKVSIIHHELHLHWKHKS